MKLYNTSSRRLETFRPQNPQQIKIYHCGPTVYDFAHIGNFTSYVYWDLLARLLAFESHPQKAFTPENLHRIMVLTDVGHLASDADDGEDKLEKGAKREGKTVWEIAEFYTKYFLDNFTALNLLPPTKFAKATDYIQPDLTLIDTLTQKGYTYQTSDGIYFDTSKFTAYPDFARLDLDHLRAGARVKFNSEKRNPSDFALWKFILPGEDHAMQWQYLDRPGYPGWHIECSSVIHQELGETIDIHTGGIDHIPVHHSNEIAQSQAAFDLPLSRFWLHCNFITIDSQKISKSLGNTYRLEDLTARGYSLMDFKLWVLQGHYQSERNFNFEDLTAAKHRRLRWRNQIARAYQQPLSTPALKADLLATLSENLNSAAAFALIDTTPPDLDTWRFIDQLFGLQLLSDPPQLTPAQQQLLTLRASARLAKDYSLSDQYRAKLEQQGITVLDTPSGQIWQYML